MTEKEKSKQESVIRQDMVFTNNSNAIRYYVKQKLSIEEECTKHVLIEFVKKSVNEPEQLTENMFTNTLRVLVDAGEIIQVSRGVYRKGSIDAIGNKIVRILKKAQQDISKVCIVNILNMGGQEMNMLPIVQQCLATMSETENTLSDKKEEGRV